MILEKENKHRELEKQSYVSEFLSLKCSGDVLNAVSPIQNAEKEISESMTIIKQLRKFVLKEPDKYHIVDLCAGNALTSVLAIHLLPIKSAVAVDIRPRERKWDLVKNFDYVNLDIMWNYNCESFKENTIIISSHPCKLARRICEIYNKSNASALVMIPCCNGKLNRKYPEIFKAKLGSYFRWSWDLAQDVDGSLYIDKKCLSPKNIVLVASKKQEEIIGWNCKQLYSKSSEKAIQDFLSGFNNKTKFTISVEPVLD